MRVATVFETVVRETQSESASHATLEARIDEIVAESGLLDRDNPFDRRPVPITAAEYVRRMAPYLSWN